MSAVAVFEFSLFLLVAILCLEVLARRLGLPPAAALIAGGALLAVAPGIPNFELDPDLVLVLFLPPLLMEGAFFTVWADFRRLIGGILSLAVGAVIFTTLIVGAVTHWVMPSLPWGACFALGAVVSPPDAVAAKAILERVHLPRRMMVLLQGESLLNDAAGLVLLRFAVAAALTGSFSLPSATGSFVMLAVGGTAVGAALGLLWLRFLPLLGNTSLMIAATFVLSWAAYITGEAIHVSGVLATVTAGLIIGWYQHETFSASMRIRSIAVWEVMVFVMESFVFILIGLALRSIRMHFGSTEHVIGVLLLPVLAVVLTVIISRFVWIFATDGIRLGLARVTGRPTTPFSVASATIMSWAGMRGVVTLAIGLALPEHMPGRDLILISAFSVILVTVVFQGTTIGWLIRVMEPKENIAFADEHLTRAQAVARMTSVQLTAIEKLAQHSNGAFRHPRLLEQFGYRARVADEYSRSETLLAEEKSAHYTAVLAAITAGRKEILRLHRAGAIHDDVLHSLEHQLDLQELSAENERA